MHEHSITPQHDPQRVITVSDYEPGPVTLKRYDPLPNVFGRPTGETVIEIPPAPPDGLDYYPVLLIDGERATPEAMVAALDADDARIEDRAAASDAIWRLREAARLTQHDVARYHAITGADTRRERRARRARARDLLAYEPRDSPEAVALERPLMTPDEVKKLFQISDRTLARWDGQVLPRSLRLGGLRRWKTAAVLRLVGS